MKAIEVLNNEISKSIIVPGYDHDYLHLDAALKYVRKPEVLSSLTEFDLSELKSELETTVNYVTASLRDHSQSNYQKQREYRQKKSKKAENEIPIISKWLKKTIYDFGRNQPIPENLYMKFKNTKGSPWRKILKLDETHAEGLVVYRDIRSATFTQHDVYAARNSFKYLDSVMVTSPYGYHIWTREEIVNGSDITHISHVDSEGTD